MRNGISGALVPAALRYSRYINSACIGFDFPPLVAYAIACNETILGELSGKWDAATIVSGDGGHGLFQLTSSWPSDWEDPDANALYAVAHFLVPARAYWLNKGMEGDDLIRCIAATFNGGLGNAIAGHAEGDVDRYTTDRYADRALAIYHHLLATGTP